MGRVGKERFDNEVVESAGDGFDPSLVESEKTSLSSSLDGMVD